MRVVCAWHRPEPKVIGEKCPQCGYRATVLIPSKFALCITDGCPVYFFHVGAGGSTDTICPECEQTMLADDKLISRSSL